MPVQLQHSRGDVELGNQLKLKDGQFFWSYINTDRRSSGGHSYSDGQLWIKDPSNDNLTEVANRRSLDSLTCRGFIDSSFNGKFTEADEVTQARFKHCHPGDFWIFKTKQTFYKNLSPIKFYEGDILLITEANYRASKTETSFRQKLESVDYIRIPSPVTDLEESDLGTKDYNETVQLLEMRLDYKGEFNSFEDFIELEKKKGYTYIASTSLKLPETTFVSAEERAARPTKDGLIFLRAGDLIRWNGLKWSIIPTGQDAENLIYTPQNEKIDAVTTFADYHKEELKSATNIKEALDILNTTKAHLGKNGRIPYEELPEAVARGLTLQGIWYPVHDATDEDANNPANQEPWPERESDFANYFWIVDCYKKHNVQYQDPLNKDRIIELNTGDMLVYSYETNQYEVIDNSDRLNSLEVSIPTVGGEKKTLLGNVGLAATKGIQLQLDGNTVIITGERLVSQSILADGTKGYFPIYADNHTNELINSVMLQDDEIQTILSSYGFRVGTLNNTQDISAYGNVGVRKTVGATKTTFRNNFFFIDSAHTKIDNTVFYRQTRVRPSERNTFAKADEDLDIYLPESSSTLLGVFLNDSLTPEYFTKASYDGFVTDTLTAERLVYDTPSRNIGKFAENFEDGFENVGIGRTTSEDIESGEITFYAKSKDNISGTGFYTQLHNIVNRSSKAARQNEHMLNRTTLQRTHLVINPTVLEDEIETFVKMPFVSGTLLTWEEFLLVFGSKGIPLMIPAWEKMKFRFGEVVGLDTSPITIKLNRPAHDNVEVERTNDLAKDYGPGKKSTWSYQHSNKEGSLQDEERTSVDDVVHFDAWLEAERSVATKEAFIIPSTAKKDGASLVDPENLTYAADAKETKNDGYGRDKQGGAYQRILPSRTLYEDEPVYYDSVTGKLIDQQTLDKDVEMPAVGGVLLTSRSRIEGGVWL